VTDRPPTLKFRFVEAVLWGAVVVVGGYLLLPAAVDLVQTTQQEQREAQETAKLELELKQVQDRLVAFPEDPEALRKLAELQDMIGRRKQND
jgi:hypothetical protein